MRASQHIIKPGVNASIWNWILIKIIDRNSITLLNASRPFLLEPLMPKPSSYINQTDVSRNINMMLLLKSNVLNQFSKKTNQSTKEEDESKQAEEEEDEDESKENKKKEEEESDDDDDDSKGGGLLTPVVEWIGGLIPRLVPNNGPAA
mmetsp:Transcript_61536/g.71610  ORF Transcript_61536/g.71610 Transcript_61536/m.71610 type:complete len:148 (+) Transcript_61536:44-487(+)